MSSPPSSTGAKISSKRAEVICAVVDGWMIGVCSRWMEKHFAFRDRLKLRPFFESRQDA